LIIYFYALKSYFGRIASYTLLLLFINPFIAERLAISTSDAVGLIFILLSISYILIGLNDNINNKKIFYGGLFLSAASLTRPLMSIFILGAIFCIACIKKHPIKDRVKATIFIVGGFLLPTLTWVTISYGVTGIWQLAGHDSSAIYAASDPQIQVWNNEMYLKVEESAKKHFNSDVVDAAQVSKEFWSLTFQNYIIHFEYHVKRFFYNVLEIIKFIPSNYLGVENNKLVKLTLLLTFGILLLISPGGNKLIKFSGVLLLSFLLFRNNFFPLEILALIGAVYLPINMLLSRNFNIGFSLLTVFWWSGVLALYLVGGIWGPPLGPTFGINALGYRLGSQFFFSTDAILIASILTIYFVSSQVLPSLKLRVFRIPLDFLIMPLCNFLHQPYGKLILNINRSILVLIALIFMIGVCKVGFRMYERHHQPPVLFPSLVTTSEFLIQKLELNPDAIKTANTYSEVINQVGAADIGIKNSDFILFHGGLSDFIWNLPRQERAKAILYPQKNIFPFELSPNELYVEFPEHIDSDEWKRKQGAWLIKSIEDRKINSNLPYFYSVTSVKAFVPIGSDGVSYSIKDTIIFKSTKNATQLDKNKELNIENADVKWYGDSGPYKYPRRFSITPNGTKPNEVKIAINLDKIKNPQLLRFCMQFEGENSLPQKNIMFRVFGETDKGVEYLLLEGDSSKMCGPSQQIKIQLDDRNYRQIVIKFIPASMSPVMFYELNVDAKDFNVIKQPQ